MVEKELKIIVTREQYYSLLEQVNWFEKREQKNYYYVDEMEKVRQQEITIRVRQIDQKYKLQVKVPMQTCGPVHMKREYETIVDGVPEVIEGSFLSSLCGFEIPSVHMVGTLTTKRRIFKWNDNVEMCLDKSFYFDVIDYEIELEYLDEIEAEFFALLEKNGIVLKDKVPGKRRRFFDQYDKVCANK